MIAFCIARGVNSFASRTGSVSLIDFGTLKDQINNDIINRFNAYEMLFSYLLTKKILKKINLHIESGIVYSKIDQYSSAALFSNIKIITASNSNNYYLTLQLSNLGLVLDNYYNKNEYIPAMLGAGITKYFTNNDLFIAYDFIYDDGIKQSEHIVSFKKKIENKLTLLISASNNKKNLTIKNVLNDILSGVGAGIRIHNIAYNLDLGMSYLGPAGYVFGVSVNFK